MKIWLFSLLFLTLSVSPRVSAESDPLDDEEAVPIASFEVTSESEPKPEPENEDATDSSGCPEGWEVYSDEENVLCMYFSNTTTTATFEDAATHCDSMGGFLTFQVPGTTNLNFVKERAEAIGGDFWIGLSKEIGYASPYEWSGNRQDTIATADELPENLSEFPSYKEQCVYVSSYTESYEADDCASEYRYVCQKGIDCKPGTFGNKCDRECHCMGETCNANASPVKCSNGCQRGWVGEACDKARREPSVKYYCVPGTSTKDDSVYVRALTNGFEHIDLKVYDRSRETYFPCSKIRSQEHYTDDGVATLRFVVGYGRSRYQYHEITQYTHVCSHYTTSTPTRWLVQITEKLGVTLEHDLSVEIKCNFSEVAKYEAVKDFSIDKTPFPDGEAAEARSPESVLDDVALTLIDAHTGEPITTAILGTPAILRLEYGFKKDSSLLSLLPMKCQATALSSNQSVEISNKRGCPVVNSPVSKFKIKSEHSMETEWFPLFSLGAATDLQFSCTFDLCFDMGGCKPKCDNNRYRRDTTEARGHGLEKVKSQAVQVVRQDKIQSSAYGTH